MIGAHEILHALRIAAEETARTSRDFGLGVAYAASVVADMIEADRREPIPPEPFWDAQISLAYDSKDGRWRVLVEAPDGRARAFEAAVLESALREAEDIVREFATEPEPTCCIDAREADPWQEWTWHDHHGHLCDRDKVEQTPGWGISVVRCVECHRPGIRTWGRDMLARVTWEDELPPV